MSWFDASGLASIAKSALKEAQRTIDKALDIKDDDTLIAPTNTPIDISDDFFGAWGVTPEELPKPMESGKLPTSIWGSFTGSFFDTKDSIDDGLDDSIEGERFSKTKLVVQHSDDTDHQLSRLPSTEFDETAKDGSELAISSKNSSESVELLTECTTSPESDLLIPSVSTPSVVNESSVEVLGSDRTISRPQSRQTDEFVSPLLSPDDTKTSPSIEKLSPESVEVIMEDQEENSVAEDTMSYTSVSESTSATVLDTATTFFAKPQKMLKDTFNENEAITRAPSRNTMHLALNLIDTQITKDNIIDIPTNEQMNDSSHSEKTIVSNDSTVESASDTSSTSNTSVRLKSLLADAMVEKTLEKTQREPSPISSESRSDLVKIGSDQTSGDELETATSSDIEIISSPNGDSSSTQSRQSPAKTGTAIKSKPEENVDNLLYKMTMKKAKGHNRELSEGSSDDSHSSEIDRLIRRISEMTEILESRECKLVEVNRKNVELQELNGVLRRELDKVLNKQLESDLSQVTEEYTQRLSALEKKFQQAIRDKDSLRKQLEQSRQENATKVSKSELETLVKEKDEVIKELREEGEKLSKQQLQHSNIIKKLRAKEKENEATIKNLKENIEELSTETDRLKRSLSAKEEVERTQIEAVHQLTAKNKKLETEIAKLQSQFDDLTQKYDTTKKSLDAAKKELIDKNRASNELQAREHLLESLENQKRMTESQNEEIINQLEDLRTKLRQNEQDYINREQLLKNENGKLLRRLEDAETRNEELSQSILEVSKPLVRQLESLQATHNLKVNSFEKIEKELMIKINDLQNKLQTSNTSEKKYRGDCVNLQTKLRSLENEMNSLKNHNEMLQVQLQQQKTERQMSEQTLRKEIDELKIQFVNEKEIREKLNRELLQLQNDLTMEKNSNEIERKRRISLQEQTPEVSRSRQNSPHDGSNSPTLSLGKVSVSESMGSSFWSQQDECFDISQTPRYSNMFEMQMLQTNLKQRDGEMQQLQWELNRREQERTLLNMEIGTLTAKVEELDGKLKDYVQSKEKFEELQQQYDTLCQLFGEKVEENEELKLDLEDVKEMYKSQIDELLRQQKEQKS